MIINGTKREKVSSSHLINNVRVEKKIQKKQEDKPKVQHQQTEITGVKKYYQKNYYNTYHEPKRNNNNNYSNRGNRNYYKRTKGYYNRNKGYDNKFKKEVETTETNEITTKVDDDTTGVVSVEKEDKHENENETIQVNEEVINDNNNKKEEDIEKNETPIIIHETSNSNIEIQNNKDEQVNEDKLLNDKFLNEQIHSKEEEIIPQTQTISNEEENVKEEEEENENENDKQQNENAFRINEQISNEGEITLLKQDDNKQQLTFQCENSTFSIQSEKTKVGTQQQQQPQTQHHQIEHTTQENKPIQHQMPPQMMCAPFIMQPGMQGMPEQKQERAQIVYVPVPYFIGYQDVDGKKPNMPNMYPMYYPMQQPYQQNAEQMQAQYYCIQPPGFYPMMVNPMGQMEQYGNKQNK